jgi:hypothetical protein
VTPLASHIPYARIKEIFDPPAKGSATNIYLQQIVVVLGSASFCLIRKKTQDIFNLDPTFRFFCMKKEYDLQK